MEEIEGDNGGYITPEEFMLGALDALAAASADGFDMSDQAVSDYFDAMDLEES